MFLDTENCDHVTDRPVFQLKGGSFTLTTLKLLSNNLQEFKQQLREKISQAPNFFKNAPVVIDLKEVNQQIYEYEIDFSCLKEILISHKLIPIGVKNGNAKQIALAAKQGLALLRDNTFSNSNSNSNSNSKTEIANKLGRQSSVLKQQSKLILEPVRTGQQICAPDGDLIVVATVSPGAELLADGHIHIYGALRGRALAGINGNTNARIFCHSLESELISIAGHYKLSEDIEYKFWKTAAEIVYKEDHLQIYPLQI